MSVSKVVKVEDIEGPGGAREHGLSTGTAVDRSKTNNTYISSTLLAYGTDSSLLQTRQETYTDVDGDVDLEAGEERDKVYPLPENWPKIDQIFRRRSCQLTTATVPCVKKAVSHLELLQDVIEDWFKTEKHDSFIKSKSQDEQRLETAAKKELRFGPTREATFQSVLSVSSKASSRTTPTLSVLGVGLEKPEGKESAPQFELPYLGAEDAIEETMTLLARLENDRQETEAALNQEQARVVRLSQRIDDHCTRRIEDLPAIVQREHEESIMDLNELQWHVSYSSRNEARIKGRAEIAEVLNKRLLQDIEFVRKHIPLVEEKLDLELEAMSKIRNAQNDTDQELGSTQVRQEKTEKKSNEAATKAETERGHIKYELDLVKDSLTSINNDLSEAKMTFNAYNHQINDIEQQLEDNKQELQVLEVKNENAKVAEELQSIKVKEVQSKIVNAELAHGELDAENSKLERELKEKKTKFTEKINALERAIKARDGKLRRVVLKNQEVDMEVQDLVDKIGACQRQKVADERNISRIHKEMAKIKQQLGITTDEFNRVASINAGIREQLVTEQEKTFKLEESLKATAEALKRQVKDEVHTRSVLSSRITADTQDMEGSRGEIRERKNKRFQRNQQSMQGFDMEYDFPESDTDSDSSSPGVPGMPLADDVDDDDESAAKVADDVVTAVKTVKKKVEKLRHTKEEKTEEKRQLSAQRQDTIRQMEESEKRFSERVTQIEPHHSQSKIDLLKVSKQLDHIEWKSEMMKSKMEDMDKSQGMMDRLVTNTAKSLVTLAAELEELKIQLAASEKVVADLKREYNEALNRVRGNEKAHQAFMEDRRKVEADLGEKKDACVERNQLLAAQYRSLQNAYIVLKDTLMNHFEDRVTIENAIKDCRQLQALQVRMNGAMMEYYKYRGLYNTSELSRMEDQSISNSHKVLGLQDNMDNALQSITEFLQTQMSGEAARKTAWETVQKQEAKAQRRGKLPTLMTSSTSHVQVSA